jgi:hypothetical protein
MSHQEMVNLNSKRGSAADMDTISYLINFCIPKEETQKQISNLGISLV